MFGPAERNLKLLREALGIRISARDGVVRVGGDREQIVVARAVLDRLVREAGVPRSRRAVLGLIAEETSRFGRGDSESVEEGMGPCSGDVAESHVEPSVWDGRLSLRSGGRPIQPKTAGQRRYIEAIRDHDLVFGFGPAGTGKTYLAVAAAVQLLKIHAVQRVVLARPAVEAGEKLGFLPGDMREKVNPYLRPLLDALHDMLDFRSIRRFMESDILEISPLAFMRGRTLNNAVILLDEAQNTTRGQMKMFLTRMGHGSRMIVTGDTTQIDLPDPSRSGLIDAVRRLRRVPGVGFAQLSGADVVRHRLVQRVIGAYGDDEAGGAHGEALRDALGGAGG